MRYLRLLRLHETETYRRRSVYHSFQSVNLHGLVKSPGSCNIGNNLEVELCGWVEVLDCIGFFLGADGCSNRVALFEKDFEDMSGDEAATPFGKSVFVSFSFCCSMNLSYLSVVKR